MIKEGILLIIILCIIFIFYNIILDRSIYVEVNGEKYKIRYIPYETDEDRLRAATMLSEIVTRGDKIVKYMYEHDIPSKEVSKRFKSRWERLRSKPWGIRETSNLESMVAYTAFKDLQMRTCLRDENGKLENLNTAMFVMLHEMAHVMSVEYGHDKEFQENFSIITNVAVELGLYSYVDYRTTPHKFCNMTINTIA